MISGGWVSAAASSAVSTTSAELMRGGSFHAGAAVAPYREPSARVIAA